MAESRDLLKYVTVYSGLLDNPNEVVDAVLYAPHGPGYILTEPEKNARPGTHRASLHEIYADNRLPDNENIVGGAAFRHLNARYPANLILPDDTAYDPVTKSLFAFESAIGDYMSRWDLKFTIDQYTPIDFRYHESPFLIYPHSDYQGFSKLHPDWPIPDEHMPPHEPDNFTLAINLYPNDDYEGGELCIRLYKKLEDGSYTFNETEDVYYKPVAGDIAIFPCAFPYEHWVALAPKDGDKRFVVNIHAIQTEQPTWQFE